MGTWSFDLWIFEWEFLFNWKYVTSMERMRSCHWKKCVSPFCLSASSSVDLFFGALQVRRSTCPKAATKSFGGIGIQAPLKNLSRNNGKANHPTGTSWPPQNSWFREFHIIRNQTRKKHCLSLKCCWLPFCGQRKWAVGTTPRKSNIRRVQETWRMLPDFLVHNKW